METDPYVVLGVAHTATDHEIKQAFRQLARECHPDVAGADEERFKSVRAAYELLSDPIRRARYDRRQDRASGPTSAFETFWRASERHASAGRTRRPRGRSGLHDPANHVSLDDLMNFDTVTINVGRGGRSERPEPPPQNARPHRPPKPEPSSATIDVPLTVALLGGSVAVTTPRGEVRVTIPPGTHGGSRLRLAGKGRSDATGQPSDFVVATRIILPTSLDDEGRALVEALGRHLERR